MKKSLFNHTLRYALLALVSAGFVDVGSAQQPIKVREFGVARGVGGGAGFAASGAVRSGFMIMGIGTSILEAGDADGDGGVSLVELKKLVASYSTAWDVDTNGVITIEELSTGLSALFPTVDVAVAGVRVAPEGATYSAAIPALAPPPPPHVHLAEGLMRFADANSDGQISTEELNAATERWFQASDIDTNSLLTAEEMNAGFHLVAGSPGTRVIIHSH